MRVLVTGGTGMLGRQVVRKLREAGHAVRVLSHRDASDDLPNGIEWVRADLAEGSGLRAATGGVDAIVHAASRFPLPGHKQISSVDVNGTQALLRAAGEARVSHLLYVSIVGIERFPRFAYYRWKLQAEELVRAGGVPWTIVRATQFYPFVGMLADAALCLPVAPVPAGARLQPVAVVDVAAYIAAQIEAGPSRCTHEIAGPTIATAATLVRSWEQAHGRRRLILPLPLPGRFGSALRDGALTSPSGDRGPHTWDEWLRSPAREREIAEYWQRLRDMRREPEAAGQRDVAGSPEAGGGPLTAKRSGR